MKDRERGSEIELTMEEVGVRKGPEPKSVVASRSWKRQGRDSPLECPKECSPADIVMVALQTFENYRTLNESCLGS